MKSGNPFWKAVVFDFDGTLARLNIDFPAIRAALVVLVERFGIPAGESGNPHILEMIDGVFESLRNGDPGRAEAFHGEAHALLKQMEIRAAGEGTLLEGTRPLLGELNRRRVRIGVVTRNCREAVLKIFPDIEECCQAFLSRESVPHVKPHPDHLLATLDLLGVSPADAAMVGDHPMDMHLGRAAGAYAIGVLTGHSGREALRLAGAERIIEKAIDILEISR